jgi:hypothetical protein
MNIEVMGENMPLGFFHIREIANYRFYSFRRSSEPYICVFRLSGFHSLAFLKNDEMLAGNNEPCIVKAHHCRNITSFLP